MPNEIERVIYKLEIDDSQYIEGVDSLSNSTKKLTAVQDAANKKLAELQKNSNNYKEVIKDLTGSIKLNEKEIDGLIAKMKALDTTSKEGKVNAAALRKEITEITKGNLAYGEQLIKTKTELTNTTAQIKLQTKEVQAAEKANGSFTSGLSKVYGGLSRVAQLIPGIGIGGLIAGLSAALVQLATAESQFEKTTKLLNEGLKASGAASAGAASEVDILKIKFDLARSRLLSKKEVLEEYNSTLGKTLGVTRSFNEAEERTIQNAEAYIKIVGLKAKAQANSNLIIKESEKVLNSELEDNRSTAAKVATFLFFNDKGDRQAYLAQVDKDKKRFEADVNNEGNAKLAILKKNQLSIEEELAFANLQFINNPKSFGKETKDSNKEIANIYEQELQKLRSDIAKINEKGFTDEASITKAVEEDFKKRDLAFEKAFKNKQLTAGQLSALQSNLANLQQLTLDKSLKDFGKQKAAYLQALDDQIQSIQNEIDLKRISNLQDRFERERLTIIAETDKTVTALTQRRDKQIADVTSNAAKNGITRAQLQSQVDVITQTYSDMVDAIEAINNQKLQKLSFDTFEKLSEDAKRLLDSGNLGISQGSLINIKKETELFLQGRISYEQYQKELTAIASFESSERFRLSKLFLEQEIKLRQDKLTIDKTLTDEQVTRLGDEIRRLQQQLSDAEKNNAIVTATDKGKSDKNDNLGRIAKYAEAIGAVVDSVVGFWQAANEAEAKALDSSISLQEKRVDAAQRIADRGNAQYLKAEEDRLTELNNKREAAARKQLGIDAALQASQILVGITGAIAKIATPGIGIAETIGSIAIIIGALATGYGLVKSLQGNQPRLAKGDKYVKRNGHPSGTDTIPAWLNEGEAVIPTDKNKKYHPAVSAIYDGTIPAEHLNNFVRTYHRIKGVPQPNYERMKDAAELHIGQDGRMSVLLSEQNKKLDENNDLQRQTLRAMKSMAVSANIDKNGVAVMVNEYISQMKIDKRT